MLQTRLTRLLLISLTFLAAGPLAALADTAPAQDGQFANLDAIGASNTTGTGASVPLLYRIRHHL
ncbi:MAG: hypothetical protein HRT45_19635 [Bdellovibrionales bacterium]|nr:hypothetical protein [Bdellovibrionales bacterium]